MPSPAQDSSLNGASAAQAEAALGADGFCEGRRRPGAAGRDAGVGAALDDDRLAPSEERGDGGGGRVFV